MPTKNNSVYLVSRCNRTGLDWNGNHEVFDSRTGGTLTRTRTGYDNPFWRSQVRAGNNATTPFTGVFDDITSIPGDFWLRCQAPGSGGTGPFYKLRLSGDVALRRCIGDPPDWGAISSTTAYNRGLLAYLKEVNSVNKAFDGLTFMGELRETSKMLRSPAKGIRNILDGYLNRLGESKRKRPKDWKKNLSSTWLESTFGMLPLLTDVQNFAQAWNSLLDKNRDTYVLVSKVGVDEKANPTNTYGELLASMVGSYAPVVLHRQRATDRAVVRFRGKVWRRVFATRYDTAAHFGFEPRQFVPTAWELLPWSFLIDYFSNIGDVIESGVTDTSRVAWTNVSEVVFRIADHYCMASPPNTQFGEGNKTVGGTASTAQHRRRTVNRYVAPELGMPYIQLELPGLPIQWANMTALWAQANSLHPQKPRRGF
jgi:hypothetical protein